MKNTFFYITILLLLTGSCKNIDANEPTPRNSFLKFFEGPFSITAAGFERTPDGFIILGNTTVEDVLNDTTYSQMVILRTDKNGKRIGEMKSLSGGIGKAIKPIITAGNLAGYVIVSDSVVTNSAADEVANINIYSIKVLFLDNDLTIIKKITFADASNQIREDYSGESVEVAPDGRVFVLGTYKRSVANQTTAPAEPMIIAFKADRTIDWTKRYDLIGRTSQNSRSVHFRNGRLTWATAIANVAGDFTNSWVAIPVVEENSVFPNFSNLGQNSQQLFVPEDIQPAASPEFGYGVVGTYSQDTRGTKGNIFFLRVDATGQIIAGSDKYFDAIESPTSGAMANRDDSQINDSGEAITAARDGGFVLAGTFNSNANKGNGLRDIFLIKVDAVGNPVWFKTVGGSGNEIPTSIRETEDGGLMVFGTSTLGNYSALFIMKTDRNGNLND
jgi:hypothetical protein